MWLRFYIEDKTGVSIFDSIPHCPTEKLPKLAEIKIEIGVPIIDSIPHCHTENAFKRGKNQEMWLRCYIEDSFVTI